jgi:hypothetical protein
VNWDGTRQTSHVQEGTYLGELSDNPYDPDSAAHPYGRYGSPYTQSQKISDIAG